MRPFHRLAACMTAAFILLGTGAQAGQVLHRPSEAEPETLDPQKLTSANALAITRDMFMGLLTLDSNEQPVPGAAEKWEISEDGKLWTFHLRHDMQWSNGDPVTSADFLYSFRRLVDPKTAAADPSNLKQVVGYDDIISGKEKDFSKFGVEALDPYTLQLKLTEPRLALKFLLTDPMLFPLHKATLEKWGNDWTRPGHIVSNGPFVMDSWTPQSDIVVKKNPRFFDAASVKLDEVHWLDAEDIEAALRRYRAGELDWIGLSRVHLGWAKQNMADQLHIAENNQIYFLFFNMAKGVLAKDARLREALNLAVDREAIVQKVDPRGEQPAYSLTPSVISDYTPPVMPLKNMTPDERIKRAKELLTAAGYGPDHPLELTITYPTQESTRQILLAILAMWKPLGVNVKLENMEWQVFVAKSNARDFEIGIMGASGTYDDYENGLDNYRSDAGNFSWGGYGNPKFDDLFRRGGTALEIGTRRQLMQEAEAVALSDYPVIPLEFGIANRLVNPKLVGMNVKIRDPQSRFFSFKE